MTRPLVGLALAVGLAVAGSAMTPLAVPAQADTVRVRTEVPSTYTAPQKGQSGAGVEALQRRLVKAGTLEPRYVTSFFGTLTEASVTRFQRQAGLAATGRVTRATWDELVSVTGRIVVAGPAIDTRCLVPGRALCADKKTDLLHYVVDSTVVRTFDARFGCAATRTREGQFSVRRKSRDHVSSIYGSAMPYAMFFSGGQAVHYSADFARRGYAGCSHGCVNLRDRAGIAWMFDRVRTGDRVVVYRS